MRASMEWLGNVPMQHGDLIGIGLALLAIWMLQRIVDRFTVAEGKRRAMREARIEHWFVRGMLNANRRELGADHPWTQQIMIEVVASWQKSHPEQVCADDHLDDVICGAMEDLHPASDLRM
jgi:hypothetical protein